jgi:hypothetical protein
MTTRSKAPPSSQDPPANEASSSNPPQPSEPAINQQDLIALINRAVTEALSGKAAQQKTEIEVNTNLQSVLQPGVPRLDGLSLPEGHWLIKLFGKEQSFWDFPFATPKDGTLPSSSDTIISKLQYQSQNQSDRLKQVYLSFIEEWTVLRQSLVYNKLIGSALIEIQASLTELVDSELINLGNFSLLQNLQHLESIIAQVTKDQLIRASVIITAAEHTVLGAEKVAHTLRAGVSGLHPDAIKAYSDLGPVPIKFTHKPVKESSASGSSSSSWSSKPNTRKPSSNGHQAKSKTAESSTPAKGAETSK